MAIKAGSNGNGTLESKIGRLEARIDSIEQNVTRMVEVVDKLSGTVHRPTIVQWGWVISGVSVIVGTAFAFTALVTLPMKETIAANAALQHTNNVRQEARMDKLLERQHVDGERAIRTEATLEVHREYNEVIHDLMLQEVRDVDLYGSRRWVDKGEK